MIIAIDFDGTICKDRYPDVGKPKSNAVESIQKLYNDGHYIIIYTCRCGEKLKDAVNALLEWGVPFHRVNDHCPANVAKYGEGGLKIYADVYIDDRNLGGFLGWTDAMQKLGYPPLT